MKHLLRGLVPLNRNRNAVLRQSWNLMSGLTFSKSKAFHCTMQHITTTCYHFVCVGGKHTFKKLVPLMKKKRRKSNNRGWVPCQWSFWESGIPLYHAAHHNYTPNITSDRDTQGLLLHKKKKKEKEKGRWCFRDGMFSIPLHCQKKKKKKGDDVSKIACSVFLCIVSTAEALIKDPLK